MSKVSNALNMYFLLQVRDFMSVDELAEKLEVTPRMIKEYKKDLEMAGLYIGSKLGRYGGYYLENKRNLDIMSFTDEELNALKMAKETIKSGKYHYSPKFEILSSKILNSKRHNEDTYYHNKSLQELDEITQREKRVWVDINLAINQQRKAKIVYKSLKANGIEIKTRLVNPYGVFDYKGASYFYGYCESAQDIRFFKLSRITELEILEDKFQVKVDFDFNEIMDKSFGIYNDEVINIKLKIHYPMSEIVKEKQISKEQIIKEIDDRTIYFEAKMKGYAEIKTWILSMGSRVEVIEPLNLKEDILEEVKRTIETYK